MKKKLLPLSLLLCLVFLLCSCSSTEQEPPQISNGQGQSEPAAPPDLSGEWIQDGADPSETYQAATISGNTIEINWISDNGSTKALYWAGSFTPPTESGDFSWDSENDKSKTDMALLASGDDTKTFSYIDGKIVYEVTAMGVTKQIALIKQ